MKLASYKNNTRDGRLMIVSRDLYYTIEAPIQTLQMALDDWKNNQPILDNLYNQLNKGLLNDRKKFDSNLCTSPLPRAYQWIDGSAYVNHVELVRKARGAEMPASFWTDPLMYQGGSDSFLGPCDPISLADENWGIDFESEVAVITDDVPMGINSVKAGQHIKLLMLVNDVSLRNLIPNELAKGFGFFQSKPSTAFSPVAITIDELSNAWNDFKVSLPLLTYLNDKIFGWPNAGIDMTFNFADLITHAAKTRPLIAGTIIGSGTVSNKDYDCGSSCLAEKRMLEIIETGKPITPFLKFGDQIKIEMLDHNNINLFGTIHQKVVPYTYHD
ncbi:MAG: fumarylacetoacetate hydrolase family protein [Alphaproteobacteria bacterium]|nr:fumarylacetoacetate hydrolase family protein [Alphaproteobacteria bacterium]